MSAQLQSVYIKFEIVSSNDARSRAPFEFFFFFFFFGGEGGGNGGGVLFFFFWGGGGGGGERGMTELEIIVLEFKVSCWGSELETDNRAVWDGGPIADRPTNYFPQNF